MIALANIYEVKEAEHVVDIIKKDYPVLFEKLVESIHLTRAFNFKYHYMECLLMGREPGQFEPKYVHKSVLRLYQRELNKVKEDPNFPVLKKLIKNIGNAGLPKIALLILGMKPESLVGATNIR